eukprot:CAMPEP_0198141162 /NCGR_PEP_ID=MMETSP1443-20131203/4213_1 /TAXON_ID=186043 /ORGANISM="Entomoneis sp., Strain CCMP2396" /LENGTH=204 /DNA_ID=CAMNT_0043803813 /DNA_START=275 /DNA_END=889 /DNA_ORIENTATION=+
MAIQDRFKVDRAPTNTDQLHPTVAEFGALIQKLEAPPRNDKSNRKSKIKINKIRTKFINRTLFVAFDKNGNGFLDQTELNDFLDVLYESYASAHCFGNSNNSDNNNGDYDDDDFSSVDDANNDIDENVESAQQQQQQLSDDILILKMTAMKRFDKNSDGKLNVYEFCNIMNELLVEEATTTTTTAEIATTTTTDALPQQETAHQ